ncbi:MAG: aminoglycoside phosphotransferase family protein [bacterium]
MSQEFNKEDQQKSVLAYLEKVFGVPIIIEQSQTVNISETLFIKNSYEQKLVLRKDVLGSSDESLIAQQKFLKHLKGRGFPAVLPIEFNGLPFFQVEGSKFTLYPFIEGRQLSVELLDEVEETFHLMGQFIAISSFYDSSEPIWHTRWWSLADYPFVNNFKCFIENYSTPPEVKQIYKTTKRQIFDYLINPVANNQLKEGIIHSDFRPEHFIFNNSCVNGVVDWTSAHHDVFAMELARPFLYICQTYEERKTLLDIVARSAGFTEDDKKAAYYSPLLLELAEYVWIVRNQTKMQAEVYNNELSKSVRTINKAFEVSKEVSRSL